MSFELRKSWMHSWEEVVQHLEVQPKTGLSSEEAEKRLAQYGPNLLQEMRKTSAWSILISQFKSLIVLLLAVAAAISLALGDWMECIAIIAVIFINALIGFITEWRAVRSMEALQKMGQVVTRVRRNGKVQEVPALSVVPGDIIELEGGDVITADMRLISSSKLETNESALTGESLPVAKKTDPRPEETPLAERTNILYKGTAVTRGSGEAVVVFTGMNTELGSISALVQEAEDEITPLEIRLNQLGNRLIWATLIIAVIVAISGILSGKEIFLMIETAIALAVAAIPEGLPVVATITLARGMWRMAKKNALINKLSAVETLGSTTVIFTDKTGTLTENRLEVSHVMIYNKNKHFQKLVPITVQFPGRSSGPSSPPDPLTYEIIKIGVLCNNASLFAKDSTEDTHSAGDPLEIALLEAGNRIGISRDDLLHKYPEVHEDAFDSDIMMMATYHQDEDRFLVAVKGAPEEILKRSRFVLTDKGVQSMTEQQRNHWFDHNEQMAHHGLRVIACAKKWVLSVKNPAYEDLVFLGLLGLEDPPRQDVGSAIQACQEAGITVIMVTGDQPVTAKNIGQFLGLVKPHQTGVSQGSTLETEDLSDEDKEKLLDTRLFARVSPAQKLHLIRLHQKNGAVVAMTGDGVNDAPALKKADIGVAMGLRGTQVAKEAADIILKDDSFSSIVTAIEQGRVIFDNIRRCVFFLLSCNISEILSIGLASFVRAPLPVLPLQILFINLVTDVFPALALSASKGDPNIMKRPPRNPKEPILTGSHWGLITGYGLSMTAAVLGSLAVARLVLHMEIAQAVTVSFLTLAITQLWHVFNMRDFRSGIFKNDVVKNPFIWGALLLCLGIIVCAVYFPPLAKVLKTENPGIRGWEVVIMMSLIPLVIGQTVMIIAQLKRKIARSRKKRMEFKAGI